MKCETKLHSDQFRFGPARRNSLTNDMKTKLLLSTCVALQFYSFTSTGLAQFAAIIHCSGGSALENAGAVTVTVTRSDNTNTVVSVDYLTKDGTGKAGADYTP